MIRDYKKLFSRDKIFLLCLAGAVALVLLYGLDGCRQIIEIRKLPPVELPSYGEKIHMIQNLWGTLELNTCHFRMLKAVFWIVAAAQIAKWHILEGRYGKEFQKLIPLKSKRYITYDYILGILYVWCPVVVSWLAVRCFMGGMYDLEDYKYWMIRGIAGLLAENTFLYILLVFSRRITNNIPGALLSSFVIGFGFYLIQWDTGRICFFSGGSGMDDKGTIVLGVFVILGMISTYLCDKKRDIAGNGTFSFDAARYFILGALFVELAVFFGSILRETKAGTVLGMTAGILLSGAVAFGIHYMVRPKRI